MNAVVTRRAALLGAFASSAAIAVPAVAAVAEIAEPQTPTDLVAVPRAVYDAIEAWGVEYRAARRASAVYADYLRPIGNRRRLGGPGITPSEKAECDRLFWEHEAAVAAAAQAHDAMMVALREAAGRQTCA